jgi:hypothetical protein
MGRDEFVVSTFRRRGVAGDPIPLETLNVLKTMSKDMKVMKNNMKSANKRLKSIEENSKYFF